MIFSYYPQYNNIREKGVEYMQYRKPMLIDFEGLDCSFKETNSKKLAEHLGGKRYEFPDYSSESSYFVRQFLSGKYKGIDANPIMLAYLMEMFDVWNTKVIPDIKNGLKFVIFDRFWYSNIYYQCKTDKDLLSLQIIKNALKLPDCHLLFKMITDFNLTIKKIREKNSKDILESDENKMREVHARFNSCTFPNVNCMYNINTFENGDFRSKDDIFNDVLSKFFVVYNSKLIGVI